MAPLHDDRSTGLPMTSKWDPERLAQETQTLIQLADRPFLSRLRGYYRLTGPAWMQSAMTLGAGSAVASVVAGAFYGYQLLWVQPIAMLLGVAMMAALGNVVLTKGERAYRIMGRELHPAIAFLWALATVISTIIWHFPQYALAGAVIWDIANVAGVPANSSAAMYAVKFGGGLAILAVNLYLVWNYGSKPAGIRLYEGFLRWVIRIVMLAFLGVVVARWMTVGVNLSGLFKGFFTFQIPNRPGAVTTILGAIGAAVGINMTFLYPYSLLARGWGPHHKGLARFDLLGSLLVPYVLLTSLIVIAMAVTIHHPPYGTNLPGHPAITALKPVDAAQSLAVLFNSSLGRLILDFGFLGMTCGAISAHMVVCGFTCCEMFGLEYTPQRYRRFTLVPVIGLLGVALPSPLWLPIAASAIAFTMLPIAYVAFYFLNNKDSYLGTGVGRWPFRPLFNIVLVLAMAMALIGSAVKIKTGVIDKLFPARSPVAAASHGQGEFSAH